jgi:hypothetical protein
MRGGKSWEYSLVDGKLLARRSRESKHDLLRRPVEEERLFQRPS